MEPPLDFDAGSLSFSLLEAADLSDGTAVMIRSDRGFSCSIGAGVPFTRSAIVDMVRGLVLETDIDEEDERYSEKYNSEWLVPRFLRLYGIGIDSQSIDDALSRPLQVDFSDRATALLRHAS